MKSQRQYVEWFLRERILHGAYPVGGRMPSTKDVAAELQVATSLVTAVYQRLATQGILEVHQGRPTVVLALPPVNGRRGRKVIVADIMATMKRLEQLHEELADSYEGD